MGEVLNLGELIVWLSQSGKSHDDECFEDNTVWLTAEQIAQVFQVAVTDVVEHIQQVYIEGELTKESTCKHFQDDELYNLDMVIALGCRAKSATAIHFRRWTASRLKEYMLKGFTIDDKRLKENGGGNYWKELLDRIRDIRSSDKMMYRQVLDLYATSIDYDSKSDEAQEFFRIVRDKLHFSAHGHTAAEVIYERADAEKPSMGLSSFSGEIPALRDVEIAKNYLSEQERKRLNNLVSGYFDLAEAATINHEPLTMKDHLERLNRILSASGEKILDGNGTVTYEQAIEKAHTEYRKYQVETVSPVEDAYLETLYEIGKQLKGKKN